MDLGENWEVKTFSPIPLGGIAVKRSLPEEIKQTIQSIVEASVLFAFKYPELSNEYVSCHAQEMDVDVMKAHIKLYVNEYSKSLGNKGRDAIETLANHYFQKDISSKELNNLFV
jgi:1,4-dihydroxy-6-naphthoate synthase